MRLFCAKGSAPPVSVAAREYGRRHDVEVRVEVCGQRCREGHEGTAGPHGFVHEILGRGYDMAISGSESDMDDLEATGTVVAGSRRGLGLREAAILVLADRAETIRSFDDLFRPGVRIAISTIDCLRGVCEDVMGRAGRIEEARGQIARRVQGCMALVDTLVQGRVDAAIGWSSFVHFHPGIVSIPLPAPYRIFRSTCATVLERAGDPEAAGAFVDYLVSEEGRAIFAEYGWICSPGPRP